MELRKPLALLVAMLSGCASRPIAPQTTPEAPPKAEEPALPSMEGDTRLSERFLRAFRVWLEDDHAEIYREIEDVEETPTTASILLERQVLIGAECRVGPSTLMITARESGGFSYALKHFGNDCCQGTRCEATPWGYHLRWHEAVRTQDWVALEQLVPAKGKLVYELTTLVEGKVQKTKSNVTRRDVAAGKFLGALGCDFIKAPPVCGEPEGKSGGFTCRCAGGGRQVGFEWKKEGNAMVVVRIEASDE